RLGRLRGGGGGRRRREGGAGRRGRRAAAPAGGGRGARAAFGCSSGADVPVHYPPRRLGQARENSGHRRSGVWPATREAPGGRGASRRAAKAQRKNSHEEHKKPQKEEKRGHHESHE